MLAGDCLIGNGKLQIFVQQIVNVRYTLIECAAVKRCRLDIHRVSGVGKPLTQTRNRNRDQLLCLGDAVCLQILLHDDTCHRTGCDADRPPVVTHRINGVNLVSGRCPLMDERLNAEAPCLQRDCLSVLCGNLVRKEGVALRHRHAQGGGVEIRACEITVVLPSWILQCLLQACEGTFHIRLVSRPVVGKAQHLKGTAGFGVLQQTVNEGAHMVILLRAAAKRGKTLLVEKNVVDHGCFLSFDVFPVL